MRARLSFKTIRQCALLSLLLLAACGCPSGPTINNGGPDVVDSANQVSSPASPPQPAAAVHGFSAAEAQGITRDVKADLLRRTYSWQGPGWGPFESCANVFDVGDPRIVDARLGDTSGQVVIVVPITGQRPTWRNPQHQQRWFPSAYCYGVMNEGLWSVGRPVPVAITYNLEHWQSGWRLAANQQQPGGM